MPYENLLRGVKINKEYGTYLFEYHHEGSWWAFTIPAASEQEAIERINKLPHAKLLGVVAMKIPAQLGFVARFLCWWRNLRARETRP